MFCLCWDSWGSQEPAGTRAGNSAAAGRSKTQEFCLTSRSKAVPGLGGKWSQEDPSVTSRLLVYSENVCTFILEPGFRSFLAFETTPWSVGTRSERPRVSHRTLLPSRGL